MINYTLYIYISRPSTNAGLMLAHRLQRRSNIKPTPFQLLVFAWIIG